MGCDSIVLSRVTPPKLTDLNELGRVDPFRIATLNQSSWKVFNNGLESRTSEGSIKRMQAK